MKILLLLVLTLSFLSVFSVVGHSQTTQTPQQRLVELQKQKADEIIKLDALRAKYEDGSEPVKAQRAKIEQLNKEISDLSVRAGNQSVLPPLSPESAKLILQITGLRAKLAICGFSEGGCDDEKRQLADSYRKAVELPDALSYLLGEAINKYDGSRISTKSAMQVSQIADEQNVELLRLVVAQNQKIIELLQRLVNKK